MLIVVTGAFGFIGSNLVKQLNLQGYNDIIAVDDLTDGSKAKYLNDCDILDYVDKDTFIEEILSGEYDNQIDYIFHLGACSATIESDGKYMMKNNYDYSVILLEYALKNEIPMIYASSAATYGLKTEFIEERQYEEPLNVYAYSKFLFDQLVRRYIDIGLKSPIVGLRYFNVYGPHEEHKGRMASVVKHHFEQYMRDGWVGLFEGYGSYKRGEQVRDFIYVADAVRLNLHFFKRHLDNQDVSGIFNCGTGIARSFNDLSLATINAVLRLKDPQSLSLDLASAIDQKLIRYIDFPEDLRGKYQSYTCANLTRLRAIGFNDEFTSLEQGITQYVEHLAFGR